MRASQETAQRWQGGLVTNLAVVMSAQLALAAVVWLTGFAAVSDDDYARVVIAQQFALSPSWDPSGTSWLPLPFWVTGGAMILGGATLETARLTSVILSCLSAVAIYFSAAFWGCRGRFRVFAAVSSAAIPYAAFLSVATVPEYPTAVAIAFGASSLYRPQQDSEAPDGRLRLLGAFVTAAATASRYEAWPAALAVSIWNIWDFVQLKRRSLNPSILLLWSALVASCFLAIWPLHGARHHNDALFFVTRVVDYKAALGQAAPSPWNSALSYPLALACQEPELVLATVLGSTSIVFSSRNATPLGPLLRPWSVVVLLVLVLIASALRGGAPTHHPERALLSCWLMLSLTFALFLSDNSSLTRRALGLALLGVVLGAALRFSDFSPREPFTERKAEEAMGRAITSLLGREAQVAILPSDFGYFALMSAAGTPERFKILTNRDPRQQHHEARGDFELQEWLKSGGCTFVAPSVAPRRDATVLHEEKGLRLFLAHHCARKSASPTSAHKSPITRPIHR